MATNFIKRLIDAGTQFGETSRDNAERVVNEMVKAGKVRRRDAEQTIQTLVERGRETSERILSMVQAEVSKQLRSLAERIDDAEDRIESLASDLAKASKSAAAKAAPVKKAAPAKQAAASS